MWVSKMIDIKKITTTKTFGKVKLKFLKIHFDWELGKGGQFSVLLFFIRVSFFFFFVFASLFILTTTQRKSCQTTTAYNLIKIIRLRLIVGWLVATVICYQLNVVIIVVCSSD